MKAQQSSDFEKISTNLDVLKNLFELLDIGDQLRFANVNRQLQFAFRNFIWQNVNHKKVKIKKFTDTLRLKSDNNRMHCDLTYEEYEYFLNIFGQQVEELHESHGRALNICKHLRNLTSIQYNYLLVTKQKIQLMAEVCPQLESILINGCCNKKHEILRLGLDIELCSLVAMRRLKSFTLKTGLNYKITYGFVESSIKNNKLPLNSSSRIVNLNIYMSTLHTRFLAFFAHLHKLTITVFYNVTSDEIIALSHACPQLKELTFHYTRFESIESFSISQNLSDLSFYHCDGLTYENLKDILTRSRLCIFTSIGSKYKGLFHYYFLAPTVKSVYIDTIKSFDFKTEMEFYNSRRNIGLN